MGSEKRRLVDLVFGTDSAARSKGISVVRLTQNLPNFLKSILSEASKLER
jgi:hypothetical protein